MTFPTKIAEESYIAGSTKTVRRFAFWPVWIPGEVVWLSFYEITYYWDVAWKPLADDKEKGFVIKKWIEVNKNVLK